MPCRLSLTFIYLVYPVLPVSLDYPFLVALSVVSGLPILGCPVGCLWITHSRLPCRLSLDYPFLVALSVVSNVYLSCVPSVASVSGLPILGCPVGCLERLFSLCTQCCQCLWITHSWLSCRLSLDYPFLVALSVVSNVYLACVPSVVCFSGLPILGCPVGCL